MAGTKRVVSQRGVVSFRKQDDLDNDLQKELAQRLGQLSGKPSTSGLHIHPIFNSGREFGGKDNEISVISSEQGKKLYKDRAYDRKQSQRRRWHSDITFEPVPSDYAILRLTQLPKVGGGKHAVLILASCKHIYSPKFADTLWASGYEVYDRISEPYQRFLEGLTATCAQPIFGQSAKENEFQLYTAPRGAPENVGDELRAVHPVIRTNPVTGWKSVFAVGSHVEKINGLSEDESRHLLNWFVTLIVENHDLQVRFRWQSPNDLGKTPRTFSGRS